MSEILEKIIEHLQQTEKMQEQIAQENMSQGIRQLQSWQTKRLLLTHDDLWTSKQFKPAMQFFIDEIYGPKDFSQRDSELARVVPKMAKLLPNKALVSLEAALNLNVLSLAMDIALIEHLGDEELNRDTYFACYRKCDNQTQREQQLQLLEDLGLDLAQVVKIKGISTMLTLSRKPAKLAGVLSLHEFLERGFKSFRKLGKVHDFIDPIVSKERHIMHTIFSANDANENPLPKVN
jgi:hypothetical protein